MEGLSSRARSEGEESRWDVKTEPENLAYLRGSGARFISFINAPRDPELQSGLPLAAHESL